MTELPKFQDRFEILRVLGRGGMGTVYLARDLRLGRQVALKVLNATELGSSERRARFMREARAAAAIRHQNVATIYEVDETTDGQPFLVLEYCEGETLSDKLRQRPCEAAEFVSIARQIAAGLAAAHQQGIVHRDIKTANIIIERAGQVKILDFGLARLLTREMGAAEKLTVESTSGHFFGTLHYISPEQARGGTADARSDLFSAGVVFYQMATGTLPFEGDSPLLVLEKIRDAEPEPFLPVDPTFPAAATRIVSRLLQKEPADRYPDAEHLLADLESIDVPTVRLTAERTTRSTLGRTVARPKWTRLALTVGALLIVAVSSFLVRRSGPTGAAPVSAAATITPIRSLAVMPLANIANNTRDEFLSVGLADALVTELQEIPSLQIRPTSSILAFQKEKLDAREAGSRLKVDGVLEGNFLAAGDLVRVTLQLTDARTGFAVWSDTVNGRRDDLLRLIDDVSSRTHIGINEKLGVSQVSQQRSRARSAEPAAYEEYLKARSLMGSFLPQQYEAQVSALRKAIQLDPQFAAAYADLAIALSLGQARSLTNEPDAMQKAEFYAKQAVRLDPNLPAAHLALGRVFVRFPDRYREAVRAALAALRLEASDTHALHSVVTYFVSTGDVPKAQCLANRLIRIDPFSNEARMRGYYNINAIDPETALQNAQYALESKETAIAGHDIRGFAYVLQGRFEQADQEAEAALAMNARSYLGKSLKAMAAAGRGDSQAAQRHVASFERDAHHNHWAAIRIAMVHARLGNRAEAIRYLRLATELGHHSWFALVKHPWFAGLQADPEFQQLAGAMKTDLDDVHEDVLGVYQLICGSN